MDRSVKTETMRRREVEDLPDQAVLDAGQKPLVAGRPGLSPAAAQQQHFHPLPYLQRPPPHAAPYVEWFEHQRGYVTDLFRQQQEALHHQLAEMQQQQLEFMQQQQQFINNIVKSMKAQALPYLDATSDSLGSSNAEEFVTDSDGDGMSTAWHKRHDELLQKKKMRSLDMLAEYSLVCDSGEPKTDFQMPEPVHNQDDLHKPGANASLRASQQQALAGSFEVSGYLDDVIEYPSKVNHSLKQHSSATLTPLHSPPDPWLKPTGSWKIAWRYNIAQLRSPNRKATLLQKKIKRERILPWRSVARFNLGLLSVLRHLEKGLESVSFRIWSSSHHHKQQQQLGQVSSKTEKFARMCQMRTTASSGQSISAQSGDVNVINRKKKLMKASDVRLESRTYTKSSAVSGSKTPTRFDTTKQPTWSLGRPPEKLQFGGTGLSAFVWCHVDLQQEDAPRR